MVCNPGFGLAEEVGRLVVRLVEGVSLLTGLFERSFGWWLEIYTSKYDIILYVQANISGFGGCACHPPPLTAHPTPTVLCTMP